jgi:DNA-binding response OmpR family regulator
MGVLSIATTPNEALDEVSDIYRGILIMDPCSIPDIDDLVDKLRRYSKNVPIFALRHSRSDVCYIACDKTIIYDVCTAGIIEEIVYYQKERGLPITSQYQLSGINASSNLDGVSFFDTPIPLTKTETMILRYLIASYPSPRDTQDILRYAFKPLRKPEPNGIRTHISVINKKFSDKINKTIIQSFAGRGYLIRTPELLESLNNGEEVGEITVEKIGAV